MVANLRDLHIHIERGPYTIEWIEKFINKAIEMNLSEINLVEHSIRIKEFHPTFKEAREYNFYQDNWFKEKEKTSHTLSEYIDLIKIIKSNNYPIKIGFGLEVCWFEQHENLIKNIINEYDFDYVLGSVHWIDNWTFNQRKYQWLGKNINDIYKRYYELNQSLIESNIFDILSHPDLISCHNLFPDYDLSNTYNQICNKANEHNICIEMNSSKSLGINGQFLKIAKENNVSFSTGSDAHKPDDVGKNIIEMNQLIKY